MSKYFRSDVTYLICIVLFSKMEYPEIVILPAQTGGLGKSAKDNVYAFKIF